MNENSINYNSNYVQVYANNKFEWNTYMIVLSRNGYKFDKYSVKEFEDRCSIAYSEIEKVVHVTLEYEVNVWEYISMKQFLYKFDMLDKAIGNEKFSKYNLEGNNDLDSLSELDCKVLKTITDAMEYDEDSNETSIEHLFEMGYISHEDYTELRDSVYTIRNFKDSLRRFLNE